MFNSKDIKVCADIVVNHRCAHKQVRCVLHPLDALRVPMGNSCLQNEICVPRAIANVCFQLTVARMLLITAVQIA